MLSRRPESYSLKVSLDKPTKAECGDEIEGDKGEDGEPEGSVESQDGWDWVQG